MLPTAHPTPDLQADVSRVEEFIRSGFSGSQVIRDDLTLIGVYVNAFTFVELNLRRAVRLLGQLSLVSNSQANNSSMEDLPGLVRRGVPALCHDQATRDAMTSDLDAIATHMEWRNLFAHWALKRLPGTETLVLMTADNRDRRVVGQPISEVDGVFYALTSGPHIRGQAELLVGLSDRLAQQVSRWLAQQRY